MKGTYNSVEALLVKSVMTKTVLVWGSSCVFCVSLKTSSHFAQQ